MAASLFQLALAVTRTIYKDQLYDWMMAITKATGSIPFITGVGPFDTVARATSGDRMLDATLDGLQQTPNGTEVWVESFGGCNWTWRTDFPFATATDNQTSCRPTAWIATGLPGAFVRNLEGIRTALSLSYTVDSTAIDNEGAGSALDPVQSDDEISRRWGIGTRARISSKITITYKQAPTGQSNYQVECYTGGSVTFVGTPIVSKPGTVLTAVTVQVRTAGAEAAWAITGAGLGATEVGKTAVITQSGTPGNVGAYATVLKDNGGGSLRVSPFGTAVVGVQGFTAVTPLVGDVIEIRANTQLNVGKFDLHSANNVAISATTGPFVAFDGVAIDGSSSTVDGIIVNNGVFVQYVRSTLQNLTLMGSAGSLAFHQLCGCTVGGATGVSAGRGSFVQLRQSGCISTFTCTAASSSTIISDTYFQNAALNCFRGSSCNTQGAAFFDRGTSDNALTVNGGAFVQQTGAVPDWGTANTGHGTTVTSGGTYNYTTKVTVNGTLGAGREAKVGGTDKIYGAVPYVEGLNLAALTLTA